MTDLHEIRASSIQFGEPAPNGGTGSLPDPWAAPDDDAMDVDQPYDNNDNNEDDDGDIDIDDDGDAQSSRDLYLALKSASRAATPTTDVASSSSRPVSRLLLAASPIDDEDRTPSLASAPPPLPPSAAPLWPPAPRPRSDSTSTVSDARVEPAARPRRTLRRRRRRSPSPDEGPAPRSKRVSRRAAATAVTTRTSASGPTSSAPLTRRRRDLFAVLQRGIDLMRRRDQYGFFGAPVDVRDVPEYLLVITDPMDFGTMAQKIKNQVYRSFDQFQADFWKVINNCRTFNARESVYVREADKLAAWAEPWFAREMAAMAEGGGAEPLPVNDMERNRELDSEWETAPEPATLVPPYCFLPDGSLGPPARGVAPSSFPRPDVRFAVPQLADPEAKGNVRPATWDDYESLPPSTGATVSTSSAPATSPPALAPWVTDFVFAGDTGRAYAASLLHFARGLPPSLQARVAARVHGLTNGASEVALQQARHLR
ncbi:pre-mRNA-splicing factor prp46 [Allomyces arbusculus]|nr:pre-mRNA-splicing factor prp46 [Allomyces arbusculus]